MFIPIGTLLWRFSKIVFEAENNKEDINNLAQKLNSRVDKIDERFIENEAKLSNIEITMGRLEEKLNLLLKLTTKNDNAADGTGG
jgi:predicted  nucleic acid-binding Zn-ribbon protein